MAQQFKASLRVLGSANNEDKEIKLDKNDEGDKGESEVASTAMTGTKAAGKLPTRAGKLWQVQCSSSPMESGMWKVLGKLGPGQLGPRQLGPGQLGPGQLGPGAQLSAP